MTKISCNVASCSYNQAGMCNASVLKIVGDQANITEETSCSTYTSKETMSNYVGEQYRKDPDPHQHPRGRAIFTPKFVGEGNGIESYGIVRTRRIFIMRYTGD